MAARKSACVSERMPEFETVPCYKSHSPSKVSRDDATVEMRRQAYLQEPLINWEGHLLEAIGPFFKARAKRQYPSVLSPREGSAICDMAPLRSGLFLAALRGVAVPERATRKNGPSASSPPGCTEKRPGAALASQLQPAAGMRLRIRLARSLF
jgi:hypothetical protein